MAKKVQAVQKVQITTTESSAYATVIRACLTASNACRRLGADDELRKLLSIKDWADREFKKAVI